jgi:RNA polymerase sigma factor (sigma-70 family)
VVVSLKLVVPDARAGDVMAKSAERTRFEMLSLPHLRAAHTLALHLMRSSADAEDAVQDAYMRAYRALHQLEGADIKPWLLTIVRNVCYRRLQERKRGGNVISLDEALGPRSTVSVRPVDFASKDPDPEQAAISASDHAMLRQAIGAMPPVFREVIVLRELEELSYRQIADVIGAPVGTVMSRLSRAREELRQVLTALMNTDGSSARDERNGK